MIAERTGRAIRRPSVHAMLAHAGSRLGTGFAFGLHEFLDQTGATIGPLITALILYLHGGYPEAFAALLVTAAVEPGIARCRAHRLSAPARTRATQAHRVTN